MHSPAGPLTGRLSHRFKVADAFFVLSAVPVLFLFALVPETFGLSWAGFGKLGRGGLVFVLFFLVLELADFRKVAVSRLNRTRKTASVILLMLAIVYFGAVAVVGPFTDSVYSVGRILGASGEVSNSWLMAMDYLVLTLYIVGLVTVFFGPRAILSILTAVVFSAGMLTMYLLDAFFPYGSLGPLQVWANFVVAGVAFLSRGFGLPVYGYSNVLTIAGKHGTFRLVVFWPSVGVHSMLIYSLVMILLAAKLDAPAKRKLIYAAVGVAGTLFLNITRIFLIALYGFAYATSGQELEAFHNSIGEILFPVWIVVFLAIVLSIEGKLAGKVKTAPAETSEPEAALPDIHHNSYLPHAIVEFLWRA